MDVDVAVIGAGPAGSTIANRLARIGYRVWLLEATRFPRGHIGESLPASILPLFEELGVREEIEDAGFLRPRGAVVHWAGETRYRTDVGNGFQVDRARFDSILLRAAVRAGAKVSQPARATKLKNAGAGEWHVTITEGATARSFTTRFAVDATGRSGCLPSRKRWNLQPPTLAISAYWKNVELTGEETLVEAAAEHWFWAAPLPDGTVNATVFVDPNCAETKPGLTERYCELLRESRLLSVCLRGERVTPLKSCTANASQVHEPVGEDWLKIGEAALALDPLSSQGVKNAIVSGLQGAAVVNTLLNESNESDSREAAISFCRDRLAENVSHHKRMSAIFYRQQAAHTPTSFWLARSLDNYPIREFPTQDLGELRRDTTVRLNLSATWQPIAALVADRIAWRNGLHLPGHRPIIWLGGVAVEELLNWQTETLRARDLLQMWSSTIGSNRAVQCLNWLYERGMLVRSDSTCEISHCEFLAT